MFAGKLCEQQNEWNLMLMVSLSVALWHSPCLSTLFHGNPCVLCLLWSICGVAAATGKA